MTALRAIGHGLRQALAVPKMLAVLWLLNVLFALPAALAIGEAIHRDLGASAMHEGLRDGFDTEWLAEYDARVQGGLGALFTPLRTGAGVVYENLDAFFAGDLFRGSRPLMALALLYGLVWILIQGAVLDRLVNPRERFTLQRFATAGGRFYARFAQLALLGLALYYALFRLAGWAFGRLDEAFRDSGTESALLLRVTIVGTAFLLLLNAVRLVLDYAKIATVVDDVGLAPLAAWRGIGFVAARPLRTVGVYAALGVIGLLFLALYTRLAPGVGQASWPALVLSFLLTQAFVAGRLYLRLAQLGAETAVYRHSGGL